MKRIGLFLFFCILSLHGIAQVENDKDTLIIRQDKINEFINEMNEADKVSIRPRACFFPLFSFLPLWLHYNLNPLCVQY